MPANIPVLPNGFDEHALEKIAAVGAGAAAGASITAESIFFLKIQKKVLKKIQKQNIQRHLPPSR
jgi:hypothetical protein